MLDRFRFLQFGLVVILAYVGVKIMLKDVLHSYHLEDEATWFSLAFIALTLGASLLISWIVDLRQKGDRSDVLKEMESESETPAADAAVDRTTNV